MLRAALVLLGIALLAALFGFGGVAGIAAGGAELLLMLFVVVLVIGAIFGFARNAA